MYNSPFLTEKHAYLRETVVKLMNELFEDDSVTQSITLESLNELENEIKNLKTSLINTIKKYENENDTNFLKGL